MKKLLLIGAVMPALAGLAACGDRTVTNNSDTMMTEEGMTNDAMLNDGMMADGAVGNDMDSANLNAQAFANTMAASDMFEIESAKIAQEKATAPALKQFASQMINDHTASTAKLKTAAASANITPAPAMTAAQEANLGALRAASGDAFDTAYKQQQVDAHQQALAALQGYARGGDSEPLKTFASETATVVEGHLNKIRAM